MAKYYMYYDFSLPVKQTPHQMVTLGCLLICSCSYLIVKLKFYHFIALSAKICYLYKHIYVFFILRIISGPRVKFVQ